MTPKKFVAFIERAIGRSLSDDEAAAFQAARDDVQGKRDTVKAMWDVARELGLKPPLEGPDDTWPGMPTPAAEGAQGASDSSQNG